MEKRKSSQNTEIWVVLIHFGNYNDDDDYGIFILDIIKKKNLLHKRKT